MSLRSKVVLFVLGVSMTFAGSSYLVQHQIVLPGFTEVEYDEARDDLARCQQAILHDAQFLSNSANDYAAWDDTYRFIEDVNEEYQSENLIPETFQNLKLNLFAFVRKDGTLVWGEIRGNQGQEKIDAPEVLVDLARADHKLVAHAQPDSKLYGVLMTPLGAMLIGSAPITTSDRTAGVRGAVIMGRLVTDTLVQEITERTRVSLRLHPLDDVPTEDRVALAHLTHGEATWIDSSSSQTLLGFAMIDDIFDRPAILLRADLPRAISQRGKSAAALAAVTTIGGGIGCTVLMWLVLSTMIVRPLTRLTSHAVRVGAEDDLRARLNMKANGEIGALAREFDRMVDRLADSRAQLLSVAHHAGMAQVATNILHNVGNVLNGIGVSADMLRNQLQKSESGTLKMAAQMLSDHQDDLAGFLTQHESGRQLPTFLTALAEQLSTEQESMFEEVKSLAQAVEHLGHIVDQQQQFTRHGPLVESVSPADIFENAIAFCAESLTRHHVEVIRAFEPIGAAALDKHRILQVLVNLLTNAVHAVKASEHSDRQITVRLRRQPREDGVHIGFQVEDNGIGIPPENMEKIFAFGFTTRSDGQGVGLHSAANLASEMGGTLGAASDGLGCGARFELSLALASEEVCV